jgi:hypothetical protein
MCGLENASYSCGKWCQSRTTVGSAKKGNRNGVLVELFFVCFDCLLGEAKGFLRD